MYVLNLLEGKFANGKTDPVMFEYRLLCSGELYNSRVLTSDWRKSDATRILFRGPFSLVVCSQPFHDYPQELCLRLSAPSVTETHGAAISMFYPDEDIARDLSAILSLLLRRLITVAGKLREVHPRRYAQESELLLDFPVSIANSLQRVHWSRKPASVVYGTSGPIEITDYNPPPLGVDPEKLTRALSRLASSPLAEPLILSARLYALALSQIEQDAQLAYQLLISSTEAVATEALRGFSPSREEMIRTKSTVVQLAMDQGLTKDQAEALAVEACTGIPWAARKFTKFLTMHTPLDVWQNDDLFHPPEMLIPKPESFEETLRAIYQARAGATHQGRAFPSSASFGIGPTVPSRLMRQFDPSGVRAAVPPVVWFERVVNSALNSFIEEGMTDDA